MNLSLPHIPERPEKPRNTGLTMVMDKGLSIHQTENLVSSAGELIDLIKFGFGTSLLTNNLAEKIKLYKAANIKPYFGGTLFEAFIIRGMFNDYKRYITKFQIDMVEVSDGSMAMEHAQKLAYISELAKEYTVLSEVGSKQKGISIPVDKWSKMMRKEIKAGSWKVIAEARESGTVGIYNSDGTANEELIDNISKTVNNDNIIWEAPIGKQQVWFIKLFGANVNLGNIAYNDVIPLECLRRGLRGDTFFTFLPDNLQKFRPG